jgi:hypothetical protein
MLSYTEGVVEFGGDEFDGFDPIDEMDAPSDWDAGTINFDPYV